jgi:hypothetical protein
LYSPFIQSTKKHKGYSKIDGIPCLYCLKFYVLIQSIANSIVLEEESDEKPSSHYEIYLEAMKECGAEISKIGGFLKSVTTSQIPKI